MLFVSICCCCFCVECLRAAIACACSHQWSPVFMFVFRAADQRQYRHTSCPKGQPNTHLKRASCVLVACPTFACLLLTFASACAPDLRRRVSRGRDCAMMQVPMLLPQVPMLCAAGSYAFAAGSYAVCCGFLCFVRSSWHVVLCLITMLLLAAVAFCCSVLCAEMPAQ